MNHKEYSKVYNQDKQALREAVRRFEQENPERFVELQARAKHELEHPPERPVIKHTPLRTSSFDVNEFIRSHHTQDYYLYTKDCWGDEHLYFESLDDETPKEVLTRRHPKFVERSETVTKVEKCQCPLCRSLN